MTLRFSFLFVLAIAVSKVYAHGHIESITSGGTVYQGYNPGLGSNSPPSAGWSTSAMDNGFVAPDAFSQPDIICHRDGTPGKAYVEAAAGSTIDLKWTTWPQSHYGPILGYIADCNGDCTIVDKTTLRFIKIDQAALKSGSNPGNWATNDLISGNFTWKVKIPSSLKAGNYVLRHEIIALHSAGQQNGAQSYPQCVNLEVTEKGSAAISGGVPATSLYKATDPGILFNLYQSFSSYPVPGPSLSTLKRRHVKDTKGLLG